MEIWEDTMKKSLIEAGCKDVKSYALVNNYGYTFTKGGMNLDLRHWRNFYGVRVNYFTLWVTDEKLDKEFVSYYLSQSKFNTFDEAVEYIKTLED